jgi:hypothetical protein
VTAVPVCEYEPAAQVRVRFWEDEAAVTVGRGNDAKEFFTHVVHKSGVIVLSEDL